MGAIAWFIFGFIGVCLLCPGWFRDIKNRSKDEVIVTLGMVFLVSALGVVLLIAGIIKLFIELLCKKN